VTRYHLDNDFLVWAVSHAGPERARLAELTKQKAKLQINAIAWYEYCRGPRSPGQLAVALRLFSEGGIIAFDEPLAERATGDVGDRARVYEAALTDYRAMRFAEAAARWSSLTDGAATVMAERARGFATDPPEPPWDGVWNATSK
jgi:hypothetical protein